MTFSALSRAVSIRIGVRIVAGPQRAGDPEALEPRQHHVEDDRVVGVRRRGPLGIVAVGFEVDHVARLGQPTPDHVGEGRIILNQQAIFHACWWFAF